MHLHKEAGRIAIIGSPPGFFITSLQLLLQKQEIRTHDQSAQGSDYIVLVEARGVEPLSENLFTRLSTSVVDILTFPLPHSYRQDYGFSRLLIPPGSSQARVGSPH